MFSRNILRKYFYMTRFITILHKFYIQILLTLDMLKEKS